MEAFELLMNEKGFNQLAILKGALENTNEAFVTIDDRQKVLFFNKAAEKIFGYSRADVVGRPLEVIMAPDCSQDHQKAIDRYIQTRVPTRIGHGTELIATRRSGERFPAEIYFPSSRWTEGLISRATSEI